MGAVGLRALGRVLQSVKPNIPSGFTTSVSEPVAV